jgi:hypothetical protein
LSIKIGPNWHFLGRFAATFGQFLRQNVKNSFLKKGHQSAPMTFSAFFEAVLSKV